MDKLSETQRTDIKKMSNVQLTSKLMAAGVSKEEIEKLDRAGMMEAWAKLVGEGKEKVLVPTGSITMGYDSALEKERLAFERMKFEAENAEKLRREELEVKKLELETRRLEEERAEKLRREDFEKIRFEEERADKLRREELERVERADQLLQITEQTELRRREIALQEAKASREEKMQATALKRFGDAMKNAISRMPTDPMELISFF